MKPIAGLDLLRLLTDAGWRVRRIKGSHHVLTKPGETKIISLPIHGNKEIKPGLATKIARDAKLSW